MADPLRGVFTSKQQARPAWRCLVTYTTIARHNVSANISQVTFKSKCAREYVQQSTRTLIHLTSSRSNMRTIPPITMYILYVRMQ